MGLRKIDGSHSLGTYTVEGRFGTEHALVVRDVVANYENGTRVRRIDETDFGCVVAFASGWFGSGSAWLKRAPTGSGSTTSSQ